MNENEISKMIIKCAIKIHKKLGPGLLESVYEKILAYELRKIGLKVKKQEPIPITYDNLIFDEGFRADLIVNNKVIIELKAIKNFESIHFKILLTYLRLTNLKLGLLINFNNELLTNGIKRVINGIIQ